MSAKLAPPPAETSATEDVKYPRTWEEHLAAIVARGPVRAEDAPIDDWPETAEERRKVAEARASIAEGRVRTHEQIEATIAEMRRRQEGG